MLNAHLLVPTPPVCEEDIEIFIHPQQNLCFFYSAVLKMCGAENTNGKIWTAVQSDAIYYCSSAIKCTKM